MRPHIRVLVVEDDPSARTLLEGLIPTLEGLSLCGVAADGWEGLEQIQRLRPDAVLLDLVMPGLDGMGLLRALRREPWRPVVVVTSQISQPSVIRHVLSLGASYYLVKPLHFEALPELLRALCLGPLERAAETYLRSLGAVGLGVEAAACAAAVLSQDPEERIALKEGYISAMAVQNTSYACVERNIRAMVGKLHQAGGAGYRALMGPLAELEQRPSNERFLRRLARQLRTLE